MGEGSEKDKEKGLPQAASFSLLSCQHPPPTNLLHPPRLCLGVKNGAEVPGAHFRCPEPPCLAQALMATAHSLAQTRLLL